MNTDGLTPDEAEEVARLPKSTFSKFLSPAERKRRAKQKAEEAAAQKQRQEASSAPSLGSVDENPPPPQAPSAAAASADNDRPAPARSVPSADDNDGLSSAASTELDEEERAKAEAIARTSFVSPAERKRRAMLKQQQQQQAQTQQDEATAPSAVASATPTAQDPGGSVGGGGEVGHNEDEAEGGPPSAIPAESDVEKKKRAAIQLVMKDASLSANERNDAIQMIIKGDFDDGAASRGGVDAVTAPRAVGNAMSAPVVRASGPGEGLVPPDDQADLGGSVSAPAPTLAEIEEANNVEPAAVPPPAASSGAGERTTEGAEDEVGELRGSTNSALKREKRERKKRAAIQKVRKDETLSPVERNLAIQKIIRGEGLAASTASSNSKRSSVRSSTNSRKSRGGSKGDASGTREEVKTGGVPPMELSDGGESESSGEYETDSSEYETDSDEYETDSSEYETDSEEEEVKGGEETEKEAPITSDHDALTMSYAPGDKNVKEGEDANNTIPAAEASLKAVATSAVVDTSSVVSVSSAVSTLSGVAAAKAKQERAKAIEAELDTEIANHAKLERQREAQIQAQLEAELQNHAALKADVEKMKQEQAAREAAAIVEAAAAKSAADEEERKREDARVAALVAAEREKLLLESMRREADDRRLQLEHERRLAADEREREQMKLRALREETDLERARFDSEKQHLRAAEDRESERMRLQSIREETEREQRRIAALREDRERQVEQHRIQEEARALQEARGQEQQRLQALREERERQQRVAQEEAMRLQAEQRRIQEERAREAQRLEEQRVLHQRLEKERKQRLIEEEHQRQQMQGARSVGFQEHPPSVHIQQQGEQPQQAEELRAVGPRPRTGARRRSSLRASASEMLHSRYDHLGAGRRPSTDSTAPYGLPNRQASIRSIPSQTPRPPSSHYDGVNDDELNWRLDCYASLSDYTIVVNRARPGPHAPDFDTSDINAIDIIPEKDGASAKKDVYYVHKAMIAVGSRRSELLGRRIRDAENRNNAPDGHSSEMNIHETVMLESAANAMGMVLDFCYYHDQPLNIALENAVPLLYLGKRYKIRALAEESEVYVLENLKSTTAMYFLLDSYLYKLDDICQRAIDVTAAHLEETVDFEPIYRLPPVLFKRVILSKDLKCDSELLSLIVYSYCGEHHAEDIDVGVEYFRELTSTRIMPQIDPKVALMVLSFYIDLILDDDEDCDIMRVMYGDSLIDRCVTVIAKHWQGEICEPLMIDAEWDDPNTPGQKRSAQNADPAALHRELPPEVQNYLLEKCILEAKVDFDAQKSTVESFEGKKKEELDRNNKQYATIIRQMQADVNKAKQVQEQEAHSNLVQIQELQQKAQELEDALEKQTRSLDEYKEELKNFRRVPGIHNFGEVAKVGTTGGEGKIIDKTKCTYSANPDHHYPNHRRGDRPPTQMPSKGSEFNNLAKENGYLYDDGKGDLLPVFFYHKRT